MVEFLWSSESHNLSNTSQGAVVKHIVKSPIEVGTEVEVVVDWKRRLDHMQQHSGQHLISGVANKKFNLNDASWNLGRLTSLITSTQEKDVCVCECGRRE